MTSENTSPATRMIVLSAAAALVAGWFVFNYSRLAAEQSGLISFVLGGVFAALVLVRPKPSGERKVFSGKAIAAAATVGACFVVAGIAVPVHQVEWLGILLILFACLAWALPPRFGRDILLALLLLYWVHPLPSQVFGPLQLGMQRLSVELSEAVLHILNVRVWADGLVLRMGERVFGVPEACSGMKTAITVLFCSAGLGLIFRFRPVAFGTLVVTGTIQVLLLNVVRISGIVWFSLGQPPDWNEKVLHDTMGIFLVLAVALVHLDAVLLKQWIERRARLRRLKAEGDYTGEDEEKLRRLPVFWRTVILRWWLVPLSALIIGVAVLPLYKLRPAHRAEMIRGVAQSLLYREPATAERAVRAALQLAPSSEDLRFDLLVALFNRGRQNEVLAMIRKGPATQRSLRDKMIEAKVLLDMKKTDEAGQILKAIPASERSYPGVAMVLAEFAATTDRPADVAVHLRNAKLGIGVQPRIRALFPYMASRDLWQTIRECDPTIPYAIPVHCVIAVEARLRGNDIDGAAKILETAMDQGGADPAFLNQALRIARERPDSRWVDRMGTLFKSTMSRLTAAELTAVIDGSFVVGRPDLAWLAFRRLESVSPEDPYLMIAPAEYGPRWFLFRRMPLSVAGSVVETTIDARPFYQGVQRMPAWGDLWDQIPLASELGGRITNEQYRKRLERCLESLKRMEAAGPLEFRLQLLNAHVLGEMGRWTEAHRRLEQFERATPQRHKEFLMAHAALYKAAGQWGEAYEALAEFARREENPPLSVWLDFASAAMSLRMGPFAVGVLEEARRDFPESEEWSLAMLGMYGYFGLPEEALFVANHMKVKADPRIRARLLMETGRVKTAERLIAIERLSDPGIKPVQTELLAPAEWAVEWRGHPLDSDDYQKEAVTLRKQDGKADFPRSLNALKLAWFEARGQGGTSDLLTWEGVGRDRRERAMALSELAMLLMRQRRMDEAKKVAERAVVHMPGWSLMQRIRLVLTRDVAESEEAVRCCPWDGEVWLAYLVLKVRSGAPATWVEQEMRRVIDGNLYSPATVVRAGDFLARRRMWTAAAMSARKAIKDGEGLLAAYVLGIRCALGVNDKEWAVACAKSAAEQALEPWKFFKVIVGLKTDKGRKPIDAVSALEELTAKYPQATEWKERLGELYFESGELAKAQQVLEDAIAREAGKKQASIRTFLLAAEAARREGNLSQSIRLLRIGRSRYPNDLNILNNLVYALAQDPQTAKEAAALVPFLIGKNKEDFALYDTAALACMRAGDVVSAERYMNKALTLVKKGDYAWLEVYLNAAETQIRIGKYKEARGNLEKVRKVSSRSPDLERRATDLLTELNRRQMEEEPL